MKFKKPDEKMAKIIFKITSTGCTPGKEKVGDTNFKDHYSAINHNMAWVTLKPFIRQAQLQYVIPYICKELFLDICEKFNNGTELAGQQSEFLELLQDTVAYYTVHHALPVLNSVISDMGVMQNAATEGTSSPVEMWRYKNTRWEVTNNADNALDRLLAFLEKMVKEEVAYFNIWKNSDCYKAIASCFFRSSEHFENCHFGTEKRRTFTALLPYIRKAEKQLIPILCKELYNELKSQVETPASLTNENKTLLTYIRPFVAELALSEAIPHLRLNIEADGIKILSSTDGMNMKKDAYESAIQALLQKVNQSAATFRSELINFLHQNVSDYPLFENSDCYKKQSCSTPVKIGENHIGGIFI